MDHEDHGLSAESMAEIMETLGISEHSSEDCALTKLIAETTGRLTMVEGPAVFVFDEHEPEWVRYRITAGERRRILAMNWEGETEIDLQPWR